MNRLFLITMMSMPMLAFAALGQDSVPTAEAQIKVLSEKLDLTAAQRMQIKPILERLHDATQSLIEDQTLSRDERLAKVQPLRRLADKKIREILSAEQKKKLDAYEAGPHPEMHGTLSARP